MNACGYAGPTSIGSGFSISVEAAGTVDLGNFHVTALYAGYDHTAAVLSNGNVVAWGSNSYGELGEWSMTYR